jgi:hypothetical protein
MWFIIRQRIKVVKTLLLAKFRQNLTKIIEVCVPTLLSNGWVTNLGNKILKIIKILIDF